MQRRFFVTIFASDRKALAKLQRLDLDLFGVAPKARGESSAGGLLTEAEIERVRGEGFRVEVIEEYVEQGRGRAKKSAGKVGQKEAAARGATPVPPVKTMSAEEWLEEFNRRKKVQ